MCVEKKVIPYKQKGMTCAIACMLMVLEYYKIIPKVTSYYEKKYFNLYRSYYMDGTPFSALAWHFVKNGLNTEILHSEKRIFNNYKKILPDDIFCKSMEEYKGFLFKAQEKGAKVINGINIDCNLLKKKLEDDNLIILAGKNDGYLHAILLCGYENNNFVVCDPLYNQKQIRTFDEINSFMYTDIGKWCVVVNRND